MSATLYQTLRDLADARTAQVALDEQAKAAKVAYETANAALLGKQTLNRTLVATLEGEVRALTITAYEAGGRTNKKVAPGAEIKDETIYTYDAAKALEWAQQTKLCLIPESLDVAAFTKVASVTPLPFVTKTTQPKAYVAKTLNAAAYLESAAEVIAP